MLRNIVISLDGTWNDKDDINTRTNVAILHEMCLDDEQTQLTYYDQGVGTDGWYDRKLGGVHGKGLSENIRQAYSWLAKQYRQGDRVFLFGFSRGAYTARSLAGLVFRCGLLPEGRIADLSKVYNAYRDWDDESMAAYKSENIFCPIAMIGVWDTVGALGVPVSFFSEANEKLFGFHDTGLSPEVEFACHAVAIDEKRKPFEPALWQETEESRHRIRQVWFPGVHADVGGGYAERHHSDIALKWMMDQAVKRGLKIKEAYSYEFTPDLNKDLHNSSFSLFGKEIAVEERDALVTTDNIPTVHWSAREKMRLRNDYQPVALRRYLVNRETLAPYVVEEEVSGSTS